MSNMRMTSFKVKFKIYKHIFKDDLQKMVLINIKVKK